MSRSPGPRAVRILGIAISIVAIVWILHRFDLREMAAVLARANPWALLPVIALIPATFVLRAWRWRLLLATKARIGLWSAFRALMAGYLFNNILPARAGDVLRAVELGNAEGVSRSAIMGTVVVERVGDLVFLLVLLSAVLLAYPALPAWLKQSGIALAGATACLLLFLGALHFQGARMMRIVTSLLARLAPAGIVERIDHIARSFMEGVSGALDPWRAVAFGGLTAAAWLTEVVIMSFVARALGLDIAMGNLIFVLLLIAVGTMVPSSPGFLGTFEFFGVSALEIIGVTGPSALAYVLLLHGVLLAGSSVLGALCVWQNRLLTPRAAGASESNRR